VRHDAPRTLTLYQWLDQIRTGDATALRTDVAIEELTLACERLEIE